MCVWWGVQGSYGKCLQVQVQLILSNNTITEGKKRGATRDKTGTTSDKNGITRDKTGTVRQAF